MKNGRTAGRTRATSRRAESCEIFRTTTSQRFSVVSFEDPPPASPAAIASRQSERLAAGAASFRPAPQSSHHIEVARANRMEWPGGVTERRGRKAWREDVTEDVEDVAAIRTE